MIVTDFIIKLGDPLEDGHGKHECITVRANCTTDLILEAFDKSTSGTNIKFKELCRGYEQSALTKDQYEYIREWIDVDDLVEVVNEEYYIEEARQFVEMLMRFTKLNLPELEWSYVELPELFKGYGYGLFT